MTIEELVKRLRDMGGGDHAVKTCHDAADKLEELAAENERLREFAEWVDTWISNPASSYSVMALDGLFGMARDRIAALTKLGGRGED